MRRLIIILVFLAVAVGGFFIYRQVSAQRQSALANGFQTEAAARGDLIASVGATGTVRANQSAMLSWQTSGQVEAIHSMVGTTVGRGEILAELSQTSLSQNVILAQAELVSAQKALEDLLEAALPAAQALQAVEDAQKALDDLEINFGRQTAQAQLSFAQAQDALKDAEYRWNVQQEGNRASGDTINATQANLILAEEEVKRAQDKYNRFSGRPGDDPARALALSNLSAARQNRDAILRQLNWLTGKPTDIDQAILNAEVALADSQLTEAQRALEIAVAGPTEAEIAVLEANLADALREWERVKDGPTADDIASAEARVAAAQATLDLASIEAPFGGTLTAVEIKAGDRVSPGQIAFRLDDLSQLLVDVEISEIDINTILVGQPVLLSFDAILDKEYQGVVHEVGVVGTVVQGTVNFNVTVELLDPDEDVKPGMTAAVNIVVNELEDVLLVPNRAVRVREGSRVVFVLEEGTPNPVEITLGASSETYSQIIDGDLQVGELIVLNPPAEPIFFGPPGGGPPGRGGGP